MHKLNPGRNPNLYVIAGPNGAGKTTFARKFLPKYARCFEFVNADLIAGGLSPFTPERAAVRAGRIMIDQIRRLSAQRRDFAFETTLSGKSYLTLFQNLKKKGYRIHLFYLWVVSADLALERISERVRMGGHDVPAGAVRRRFIKGLAHFVGLYRPLLDSWYIYDNSMETPKLVAFKRSGVRRILETETFKRIFPGSEQP
jgi:predicted ABC-type ATPase